MSQSTGRPKCQGDVSSQRSFFDAVPLSQPRSLFELLNLYHLLRVLENMPDQLPVTLDGLRLTLKERGHPVKDAILRANEEKLTSQNSVDAAVAIYLGFLVEALEKEKDDKIEALEKEKDDLEKEKDDKIEALEKELLQVKSKRRASNSVLPLGFVPSISAASKDKTKRDMYYAEYLNATPVRGGFVAHKMFVCFVKGARGNHENKWDEALQLFQDKASGLVTALSKRVAGSFLSTFKPDLEAPQSLVASELLLMALDVWKEVLPTESRTHHIFVGHQGEIKSEAPADENLLYVVTNAGEGKGKTKKSVEYKVDVIVNVVSEEKVKVLATVEYKPDSRESDARKAQRDMYATNTISLYQRPCIGLDISGGNDVSEWSVTANAYFANPIDDGSRFQFSEMYAGKGLEALLEVAHGLREAAKGWKDADIEKEARLSPVVAMHGERVLKVYDDAQYRKPNKDTLQTMLEDETVSIWKSSDEKVVIMDMQRRDCQWFDCNVQSRVFFRIMQKLTELHKKGMTHGDIRLANLLHGDGNGYIIDCDFVHLEMYPSGLLNLNLDGRRHPDVVDAIEKGTVQTLKMKPEHDLYAFGKVMSLFECVDGGNSSDWDAAMDSLISKEEEEKKEEDQSQCFAKLERINFDVRLSKSVADLFETGATPQKKAATQNLASVDEEDEERGCT